MPKVSGFFQGSTIKQKPPTRLLPQCGACGLGKRCTTPKMPCYGAGGRGVLFVGEAPGEKEDKRGTQLVGPPGKYLKRILGGLDFDIAVDGWKTNAVLCHPRRRKPTPAEVGYCRPNIIKLIKELNPAVIVPMGVSAVNAVIGSIWKEDVGQMSRWAGWDIPCQALNAWVCPTWHPAYLMHEDDPVLEKQFKAHIKRAVAHTTRPWPSGPPDWRGDVHIETDVGKAARWLHKAARMQTGAVAWDYECNMLKPDSDDATIVSCSVAWGREEPERCIAFPWHGAAIPAMKKLLSSPIPKIASNMKFEDRWTRKEFGHRVRGWAWDTMLAAHVCDNRPGITSVKFQGFARLGVPVWNDNIETFLKSKGSKKVNQILEEIDVDDLLLYNGLDSIIEFRVAMHQLGELGHPIPWRLK